MCLFITGKSYFCCSDVLCLNKGKQIQSDSYTPQAMRNRLNVPYSFSNQHITQNRYYTTSIVTLDPTMLPVITLECFKFSQDGYIDEPIGRIVVIDTMYANQLQNIHQKDREYPKRNRASVTLLYCYKLSLYK